MAILKPVLVMSIVVMISTFTTGQAGAQDTEIAAPAKGSAKIVLDELGTEFDFSLSYLNFADQDMDATYSYLPMLGAGISFRIAPELRTFLALRYGKKSGDPYHDLPGFDSGPDITVKTLPFLLGLKYNLARSSRIRVQVGYALMLAYTREAGITQVGYNNTLDDSAASEILTGYLMTFAPEWIVGSGSQAVGLEMSYGGTKGTLHSDYDSHDIDLTGFSGRLYYLFNLGGS